VALAGAVVALSVVLATSPRGLQVRAVAGPAGIALPAIGRSPARIQVGLPAAAPWKICAIHAGGPFQVALPARPGRVITVKPGQVTITPGQIKAKAGQIKARPGWITLMPAMVCPSR
jgi:hypothetical protein